MCRVSDSLCVALLVYGRLIDKVACCSCMGIPKDFLIQNKHKVICEQRLYINLCTQMKTIATITGLRMYAHWPGRVFVYVWGLKCVRARVNMWCVCVCDVCRVCVVCECHVCVSCVCVVCCVCVCRVCVCGVCVCGVCVWCVCVVCVWCVCGVCGMCVWCVCGVCVCGVCV